MGLFSSSSSSEQRETTQVSNLALEQIFAPLSIAGSGGKVTESGGVSIDLSAERGGVGKKGNVAITTNVIDPGAFALASQVQRDQSILTALNLDFAGEAIRDSFNLAQNVSDQAGRLASESTVALGDLSSDFRDSLEGFARASTRDDSDRIQTVVGWLIAAGVVYAGFRAWQGRA